VTARTLNGFADGILANSPGWYGFLSPNFMIKSVAMANATMEIVKLKQGGTQVVRFKGLVTAGVEWIYENSNEGGAGVQKSFDSDGGATKNLGFSATEIFTITALRRGEATLRFRQVRQWEPGKPPKDEKLMKLLVD